jgi:EpsI family protein
MPRINFLASRRVAAATCILLLQAAVFYGLPKERPTNLQRPLRAFPPVIGEWRVISDTPVEPEVLNVLKADDTLSRVYANMGTRSAANLFIAFFRSQATGVAPHSPKNCLPGSGWAVSASDMLDIAIPGPQGAIRVNRYVVGKGDAKSLVLYWYQSHNRAVASEYAAKIYLVLDSIRYRRSDTSIVRVTVPVSRNDEASAQNIATAFVQASFGSINETLPH